MDKYNELTIQVRQLLHNKLGPEIAPEVVLELLDDCTESIIELIKKSEVAPVCDSNKIITCGFSRKQIIEKLIDLQLHWIMKEISMFGTTTIIRNHLSNESYSDEELKEFFKYRFKRNGELKKRFKY